MLFLYKIPPFPEPSFHNPLFWFNIMATFESVQTGNIHIDEGERKMKDLSPLAKDRLQYQPRYPESLQNPEKINVCLFCMVIMCVAWILW